MAPSSPFTGPCTLQAAVVLLAVALGGGPAQAYRLTMTAKVHEARWGNGIAELVYAGVGCRVVVVDMSEVASLSLADGLIATSESLCNTEAKNASGAAVSTLAVSMDGGTLVAATSVGGGRLYALELVYEGKRMGQLKVTAVSKPLRGVIVRVSDASFDNDLGFEVYWAVTTHTVYCLRYDLGVFDVIASIVLEPNLRDVTLLDAGTMAVTGGSRATPSPSTRIVVSSASGLLVLEKKRNALVLGAIITSPGTGNDGFAVADSSFAFVAAGGAGLRVFDLGDSGSLLTTQALPDGAGWAGGVAAASSITADDAASVSYLAVVASDAGIFGYQARMNGTNTPQVSLAWDLKLGKSNGGCGWNIVMGKRQCKMYVSDKAAGLIVVDVCSTQPTVIGRLQM
jgi:hypothetical protein